MLYKPYVIKLRQIDPVLSAEIFTAFYSLKSSFSSFFYSSRLTPYYNHKRGRNCSSKSSLKR